MNFPAIANRGMIEPLAFVNHGKDLGVRSKHPDFCGALLMGINKSLEIIHIDETYLSYIVGKESTRHRSQYTNDCKLIRICRLDEIQKVIIHQPASYEDYLGINALANSSESIEHRSPDACTIVFKPYIPNLMDPYTRLKSVAKHGHHKFDSQIKPNNSHHMSQRMSDEAIDNKHSNNRHWQTAHHKKDGYFHSPDASRLSAFDRTGMKSQRPSYTPKGNSAVAVKVQTSPIDGGSHSASPPRTGSFAHKSHVSPLAKVIPLEFDNTLGVECFLEHDHEVNQQQFGIPEDGLGLGMREGSETDNSNSGSTNYTRYKKILLRSLPNQSLVNDGAADAFESKSISFNAQRQPKFQCKIHNFSMNLKNDNKERIFNKLKFDTVLSHAPRQSTEDLGNLVARLNVKKQYNYESEEARQFAEDIAKGKKS